MSGTPVDLSAVRGGASGGGGVSHGRELLEFTEAVMQGDASTLGPARETLRGALGSEAVVEAAAVMAAFHFVDRVADATGIPIDEATKQFRDGIGKELGMSHLRPELRAR